MVVGTKKANAVSPAVRASLETDLPTDPELRGGQVRTNMIAQDGDDDGSSRTEHDRSGNGHGRGGGTNKKKWGLLLAMLVVVIIVVVTKTSANKGEVAASSVNHHCSRNREECSRTEWCLSTVESFECIPCPAYHVSSLNGLNCVRRECPEDSVPTKTGGGCIFDMWCGPSVTLLSEQRIPFQLEEGLHIGTSVASMGDWDGNGEVDVAVGAGGGAHIDGAVYIVLMGPGSRPGFEIKVSGHSPLGHWEGFGSSVACPGDLDSDGVRDLIVGAQFNDDGGRGNNNQGALYILWLEKTTAKVKKQKKISSTQGGLGLSLKEHDNFGRHLSVMGDVDKNGVVDVVVGSIRAAYLLLLNADGTVKVGSRLKEFDDVPIPDTNRESVWWEERPGRMGGVAAVGDVNGDGVGDIVVGRPGMGSSRGKVIVVFLREGGSGVQGEQQISATTGGLKGQLEEGGRFGGHGIAGLGDLDGDGTPDIAVGATQTGLGKGMLGKAGAVYILCLTPTGAVKAEQIIAGDHRGGLTQDLVSGDRFGRSVVALVKRGEDNEGGGVVTLVVGADRETRQDVYRTGGVHILTLPSSYVDVCHGEKKTCAPSIAEDEGWSDYTCGGAAP